MTAPDRSANGAAPHAPDTYAYLAANVEYGYALGWSFTPLSGKRPTLSGWQSRPRESLDEALSWAARQNVGLRTGHAASGIVVIDVDAGGDVQCLDLPPTVTVNTGRDGLHLYYRCDVPLGNSAGRLGRHIDIRGDGGQVVYPGSLHPDTGRRYEWAAGAAPWECLVADLPEAVMVRLAASADRQGSRAQTDSPAAATVSTSRRTRAEKYAAAAVKLECNSVLRAPEGTRNDTLNSAAFALGTLVGGGYLARGDVESALTEAAVAAGLVAAEISPTLRSGLESGIARPRRISDDAARPAEPPPVRVPRSEYVLVPGAHVDSDGVYTEQSTATFAAKIVERLPADTLYRKDFLPGEVLGEAGR